MEIRNLKHSNTNLIVHSLTLSIVLTAAVLMARQGYDPTGTASVIAAAGLAARLSSITLPDRIGRR